MILRRVLAVAAAIGAVLAGAGVVIVAGAYAIYAALLPFMPRAAAAAVLAAIAAVVVVAVALVTVNKALPHKPKPPKDQPRSLVDQALDVARQKPLLAAGGALAAGLIALRNPAVITTLLGLAASQNNGRPNR